MSRAKASVSKWLAAVDESISAGGGINAPYRLGRLDRATRHYNPQRVSGDLAVIESEDVMHSRTRDGVRNNHSLKRVVEIWQDLVAGCGMQTLADPFEPWIDIASLTTDELDARLDYALESDELYSEWFADKSQCDAEQRLTGAEMQRMAIRELATVGEVFVIEFFNSTAAPDQVPLCYQLVESDQLDRSMHRQRAPGQNKIVAGIELDEWNREVAFYLFDEAQTDALTASTSTRRVEASRCWHLYRPTRPTQHLGATELAACGQPMIDRDKYITSELQTAAKIAQLAVAYKSRKGAGASMGILGDSDSVDQYGNQDVRLGSSPIAVAIGTDEEIQVIESTRPNGNAREFLEVVDHDAAVGGGVSYYSLRGDYSSSAFSSARAAKLDEDLHFAPIQAWFAANFAVPMRKRFNEISALMGLISNCSPREFLANRRRYQRFEAMGPGRELLAPGEESEAAIARLRSSLSTLKIECARRGLHWVRVLRQKAIENRVSEVLGVLLDFSKGQGGQVVSTTTQAKPNEQGAAP